VLFELLFLILQSYIFYRRIPRFYTRKSQVGFKNIVDAACIFTKIKIWLYFCAVLAAGLVMAT
jgi:hypothetical protein